MWSQIVLTVTGVWIMIAPAVFDFNKKISDNAHIVGPLITTFSMIAIWECTRNVRWMNLPLALWLLLAPWLLDYQDSIATIHDSVAGIVVAALCFVKPARKHRFGGGWPAIWRSGSLHSREARTLR